MTIETLEYLEQVLSGLRSRYASGDRSVENKLRAIAAKVDQLKLQKDLVKQPNTTKRLINNLIRRRSCCR